MIEKIEPGKRYYYVRSEEVFLLTTKKIDFCYGSGQNKIFITSTHDENGKHEVGIIELRKNKKQAFLAYYESILEGEISILNKAISDFKNESEYLLEKLKEFQDGQ